MKDIKIIKITRISPPIITKEGKKLYFADIEGSLVTEDIKDINNMIEEIIEHYKKMRIK